MLLGFGSPTMPHSSGGLSKLQEQRKAATRLLVRPRAGLSLEQLDEILRTHGARRIGKIPKIDIHIVELDSGLEPQAAVLVIQRHPDIESAEIDERVPPSPDPDAIPGGRQN
jgi:hypothetical protein